MSSTWRGDLTGGFTAALIGLPTSIGYGIMALAPLGPEHLPLGVLAGLYACICGCLTALLLGANTAMIYAPRSISTFLIGSLIAQNLVRAAANAVPGLESTHFLTLVFAMIFLAGAMQSVIGAVRAGNLVKYLPAPVLAGFQNAAAVLIIASQIHLLLGFSAPVPLPELPGYVNSIQPLTLLVGLVTIVLFLHGSRLTRRMPSSLLGCGAGILLYYALVAAGQTSELGGVIGDMPRAWPAPDYLPKFAGLAAEPGAAALLPVLFFSAASLALISALDSLLCARVLESESGHRFSANRELVRIGAGNMVSAAFGGIANGVSLAMSFAAHRAGARTPMAVLITAAAFLVAVLVLSPLLALLPKVVVGAMLIAVALQLFDSWTLGIAARLFRGPPGERYGVLIDLAVIVLVAMIAIFANIVLAVLLGVIITIVFFIARMSRSLIRRTYRCDDVHSRKTRDPHLMELLSAHGQRIAVLELEGPLFFGTADDLAARVESTARDGVSHVILDFRRVNDIDSTGARILLQIQDRITTRGGHLLISAVNPESTVMRTLSESSVIAAIGSSRVMADTDSAIEHCEEQVILDVLGDRELGDEFPFARFDALSGLETSALHIVRNLLERRAFEAGETVFREGDNGRELFLIASGSASVRLQLAGTRRTTRLITFSAGTVFGELALLDQEVRSATVVADESLVCYALSQDNFNTLAREHPDIAIKLLANLARELAGRLRRANRTIQQLDS